MFNPLKAASPAAIKYIMKKESTRDHLDLLLSSKHWPVVCAVHMACDVVAHAEVCNLRVSVVIVFSVSGLCTILLYTHTHAHTHTSLLISQNL